MKLANTQSFSLENPPKGIVRNGGAFNFEKRGLIMDFEIDKEKLHKSYDEFMEKHRELKDITLGNDCKIITGSIPVSMIKNTETTEE